MRGQHGEHFSQNKGALGNAGVNATLENPVQFWTFGSAHPGGCRGVWSGSGMKAKRATRDLDPPLSGCVRVTTRGQMPALMLVYLPETHQVKTKNAGVTQQDEIF